MENLDDIAKELFDTKENIILIYAFNGTGKTRLSVAYKDFTKKQNEEKHMGVYYNAFSEDLFIWDNDEENNNENIRLKINYSNLSNFHSYLDVKDVEKKLEMYNHNYKFDFNLNDDLEKGIDSISFFIDDENSQPIKISRGEERIFIWCFFLALFEVDIWSENEQDAHFFIDDPVSSMDEHNIFITARSIFDLIEEHYLKKKIIITTHHIGLFSILHDKLKKGEKSDRYRNLTKPFILKRDNDELALTSIRNDVFLFHLHLMQVIDTDRNTGLFVYHFALLRQLLENISSFVGSGRIGYVLEKIGIEKEKVSDTIERINSLSHKNIYKLQLNTLNKQDEELFIDIFQKIQNKYNFKY